MCHFGAFSSLPRDSIDSASQSEHYRGYDNAKRSFWSLQIPGRLVGSDLRAKHALKRYFRTYSMSYIYVFVHRDAFRHMDNWIRESDQSTFLPRSLVFNFTFNCKFWWLWHFPHSVTRLSYDYLTIIMLGTRPHGSSIKCAVPSMTFRSFQVASASENSIWVLLPVYCTIILRLSYINAVAYETL